MQLSLILNSELPQTQINQVNKTREHVFVRPLIGADNHYTDMASMRPVDIVAWIFFAVLLKNSDCQGYSWSVSVPLNISVCSNSLSNPLTLDWTYTPVTPDPLLIEWSKQGTGSSFNTIASYSASKFTPSAAYTGRVSRTGSTAEIAIQGPLTAADGGVYRVDVTNSVGNTLSGFANVIIPAVNGPINASCVENPANVYTVTCSVDVSPPVTLQLKNGTVDLDSASSASGLSKTLSDAHTQTFQCSVTGEGSKCVTPNSADVTCISDGPYQISLTPSTSSYTVTEHQVLPSITCSALCRPGCTYRWLHNGTSFSSGATLSLGQADRSKTGSYMCQPYNIHRSSDSVTVSVDVQYPAEVVLETEGSATCQPHRVYVGQQNVQLTCRVTAANPAVTSYTWTHNSSVIQSVRGAVFTISSVSRTSGGSYTCLGSNSFGGSTSSPVTLEVQYPPSVSVPSSQTVIETQILTVTCSVDSKPAAAVAWTRTNSSSFPPQSGSTLTISNIQRPQTGTYVCTATNTLSPCRGTALPRSESREMTVDVQYPATVSMFTANSLGGSVTVNESDPVTLRCQVDSNPRPTIRLLNGTEELTRADNSLISEYRLDSADCRQRGNYSCTATNNIGAPVSQRVELLVKCSPRLDETMPQQLEYTSRLGGNVDVSVSVLAYPLPTFTWSRTTSTSQDLTGSSSPVSDISVTARLHLTYLQQQDFGDYRLTVDNGVDRRLFYTVRIVPEDSPDSGAARTGPIAWTATDTEKLPFTHCRNSNDDAII